MTFLAPVACCILFSAAVPAPDPNAEKIANSKLIRISDIEPLVRKWTRCPKFFKLKGQITSCNDRKIVLRDESGNIEIQCKDSVTNSWSAGDIVELHAHANLMPTRMWSFYVKATEMTKLGHADPPPADRISPGDIAEGAFDFHEIVLTGLVADAVPDDIDSHWYMLFLKRGERQTLAMVPATEIDRDDLDSLIGAIVSVRGLCVPNAFMTRIIPFPHVIAYHDGLSVVTPAPEDPFSVDEFRPTRENRIRSDSGSSRQLVTGTVVATWRGKALFLRLENDERIEVRLGYRVQPPPVGSRITASGFIKHDSYYTRLLHSAIRIDDDTIEKREPATDTDMRHMLMLDDRKNGFGARQNGHAIRICGTIAEVHSLGTPDAQVDILSDEHRLTVLIGPEVEPPAIGSRVAVSGVCLFATETEDNMLGMTRLKGFSLVTRDASDICVQNTPPWWTPARLFVLIGALIALITALVWRNRQKEKRSAYESQLRIDERTRLAVELHDSLAQNLTGISLRLDAAKMAEGEDRTVALTHLSNAREALRSCREGLRYCLSDLRSRSFEDTDMTEAVTETVRPHIGKTRLAVRFNVPRAKLSDSTAHAVLCIVRELAVNAVRHGHATEIHVAGEFRDGQIRFSVRDNGCGFNPGSRPGSAQGHFGLLGVNERVSAFKGTLRIDSAIGKGTKATVILNIL